MRLIALLLLAALSLPVHAQLITTASEGVVSATSDLGMPRQMKRYELRYSLWAHLGEPAEKFEFSWELDENLQIGTIDRNGLLLDFSVADLGSQPKLLEEFRKIRPSRIEILVDVEFLVGGTIAARAQKLVVPDLLPPADQRPAIVVAGSPRWKDVLLDKTIMPSTTSSDQQRLWDTTLPNGQYKSLIQYEPGGTELTNNDGQSTKHLYYASDRIRLLNPRIVYFEFPADTMDRIVRNWMGEEGYDPSTYNGLMDSVYAYRSSSSPEARGGTQISKSAQRERERKLEQQRAQARQRKEQEAFSREMDRIEREYSIKREAQQKFRKSEEFRRYRQEQTHGKIVSDAMEWDRETEALAQDIGEAVGDWVANAAKQKRLAYERQLRRQQEMYEAVKAAEKDNNRLAGDSKTQFDQVLSFEFKSYKIRLPYELADQGLDAIYSRATIGPETGWSEYDRLVNSVASAEWSNARQLIKQLRSRLNELAGSRAKSEFRGLLDYLDALGSIRLIGNDKSGEYDLRGHLEAIPLVQQALNFVTPGPLREMMKDTLIQLDRDVAILVMSDVWSSRYHGLQNDPKIQKIKRLIKRHGNRNSPELSRLAGFLDHYALFYGSNLTDPGFYGVRNRIRDFLSSLAFLAWQHGHSRTALNATNDFFMHTARKITRDDERDLWHDALQFDRGSYSIMGLREIQELRLRIMMDLGATGDEYDAAIFRQFDYGDGYTGRARAVEADSTSALLSVFIGDFEGASDIAWRGRKDMLDLEKNARYKSSPHYLRGVDAARLDFAVASAVAGIKGYEMTRRPEWGGSWKKNLKRAEAVLKGMDDRYYPPLIDGMLIAGELKRARKYTYGEGYAGMRLDASGGIATVGYVTPTGPAARAGIKSGDRILSINGDSVTDMSSSRLTGKNLEDRIRAIGRKDTAIFVIERDGKQLTIETPLVNNKRFKALKR